MSPNQLNTWVRRRLCKPLMCALAVALFSAHPASVFATTITFDELSERPLDGVSLKGVTFHSTGSNSDFPQALFGTTQMDFGETKIMSAPWAAGSTSGELTVDFLSPVSSISFDAGVTTTLTLADGFHVSLYSGSKLVDMIVVATAPGGPGPFAFSEAAFAFSQDVPLTSMTITFASAGNYAFDNLTYSAVPEPGTILLLAIPLLALFVVRGRRTSLLRPAAPARLSLADNIPRVS
jgi:hypothetical protein